MHHVVLVNDCRVSMLGVRRGHPHPLDQRREDDVRPLVNQLLDRCPGGRVLRVLELAAPHEVEEGVECGGAPRHLGAGGRCGRDHLV